MDRTLARTEVTRLLAWDAASGRVISAEAGSPAYRGREGMLMCVNRYVTAVTRPACQSVSPVWR
jgi:hypothetical protein